MKDTRRERKNNKTDKKVKKNILVFSNGSFGDGSIAETVLQELHEFTDRDEFDIIYVANKESLIPGGFKADHVYSTPSILFNDPYVGPADTNQSIGAYFFNHMLNVKSVMDWANQTTLLVKEMYELYSPYKVVLHFSMLPLVMRLEFEEKGILHLDKIPIYVFYYVPSIANKTVPWVFDSRLRDRQYRIYSKSEEEKKVISESWDTILKRFTFSSPSSLFNSQKRKEFALRFLDDVNHLTMWPKSFIPPIKPISRGMNIVNVGLNMSSGGKTNKKVEKVLPKEIKAVLKASKQMNKPVAFISFGSFAKFLHLRALIPYIVQQLSMSHSTIVHKTWKDEVDDKICSRALQDINNNSRVSHACHVYEGFISYDLISQEVSIVVGSGSLGLQSFSIKHQTPIMMVPIITEQYYWAKNYQHFTKIPYVDIVEAQSYPVEDQVKKALDKIYTKGYGGAKTNVKPNVERFLKKVSGEMMKRDGLLLAKTVMKERRGKKELK